ncbi:unnamed protein product [Miscanthus lutarioriparius]|uniref:Protein FAR1-RELATED SEQUENCE n=1 Tax=Miscanthus lutarioriparius TaxID=422564 RepID=A0A811QWE5_9POAL|nr:unnamed protein product [Miscanthus lutarioriparius]
MVATCTYMLFETHGIPCRHIIPVLRCARINELSSYYLLERFTQGCKKTPVFDVDGTLLEENSSNQNDPETQKLLSECCRQMEKLVTQAKQSPTAMCLLRDELIEVGQKLSEMVPENNLDAFLYGLVFTSGHSEITILGLIMEISNNERLLVANLRSAACRPSSTTTNWRLGANLKSRGSARAGFGGSAEESVQGRPEGAVRGEEARGELSRRPGRRDGVASLVEESGGEPGAVAERRRPGGSSGRLPTGGRSGGDGRRRHEARSACVQSAGGVVLQRGGGGRGARRAEAAAGAAGGRATGGGQARSSASAQSVADQLYAYAQASSDGDLAYSRHGSQVRPSDSFSDGERLE